MCTIFNWLNRSRSKLSTRNYRSKRKGAATIEMAFVAPVIFLLVFGSIEFSRMMMVRQALTNAAREGCRNACLATTSDKARPIAVVRETLQGVLSDTESESVLRVSVTPDFTVIPSSGTIVTITVEVDCADVSFLPPMFFSDATLSATSSMKRE